MKILLGQRRLRNFIILGVVVCTSVFMLFSTKPFLAHADAKTLEGMWNVQTQFISGPLAGQTKQGTITYAADGTLTSQTDGITGTGTWQMTSQLSFHYQFIEQIYQNGHNIGYVSVSEDGVLAKDFKTNVANGTGTFFANTPGGPVSTGPSNETALQDRIKKLYDGTKPAK